MPERYFVFTCCSASTRKRTNFDLCAYACARAYARFHGEIRIAVFALALLLPIREKLTNKTILLILFLSFSLAQGSIHNSLVNQPIVSRGTQRTKQTCHRFCQL